MITFCIPSKNNLRYLKTCIKSIQDNSHFDNKVLVYVDQDNDGTEDWLQENGIPYILNTEKECKGIGYAYDTMFKEANTDLVAAFHADMILGPNADLHLVKHHKRGAVVCATRIEPPLHPPGPEKVVMDFGMWPEDIKLEEFDTFVKEQTAINIDKTTKSSFAPWLIHKEDHLGHDPIFLSVFEDADLFRRFKLAGYDTIQSWSSYVYHLTCRGGQFEHAKVTEDLQIQSRSADWQRNNQISLREYIRKWGGMFKEYGPCEPKPNIKYNVGLELIDAQDQMVAIVEPFFDKLKADCDYSNYINIEQPNTKFDLKSKFVNELNTDIIITYKLDAGTFRNFLYVVENLEELLEGADANATYEADDIKVQVKTKAVTNIQTRI
jgi:glycosyltransferase involved in cell wall biosynthesis